MQKLWIASELFFPEETSTSFILTKVANKLVEKYDVKVICGVPIQEKQSISSTFFLNPKVSIHRVHSWFKDKNSLLQRSLRFIYLSFSIFFYLLWRVKKHDKVLIVTNPAPLILLISLLKFLKSNELIILVHDVFPENTVPAGILKSQNSLPYKTLKKIFDWAYRNADLLIVLGRDMHEVILSKIGGSDNENKIKIIENWADIDQIYPLKKSEYEDIRLKSKIVFQYAGNLGRVQGLMELLETIQKVDNNALVFQFVGEGAIKEKMVDFVRNNNLKNVYFGKGYNRDEQLGILNQSDVGFVSLASGMYGLGVPSKAYNILAAGKSILYIGEKNSEIDLLIKERNIGYSFQDTRELLSFFNNFGEASRADLKVKQINAREVATNYFSETIILNKFYELI